MIKKIAYLIFLATFLLGLFTLSDYGINWDTPNHWLRGQVYLNYIMTGSKDYSNLTPISEIKDYRGLPSRYFQNPDTVFLDTNIDNKIARKRSAYQIDGYDFNYYMTIDGYGHPAASDIIGSFFNYVLFQKLGLINDVDSYRVYSVLLASLSVSILFYWIATVLGTWQGIFASIAYYFYPLFWAELHFNSDKDIPETSFWVIGIYLIFQAFEKKNWKKVILFAVIIGLALGTKLNVIFLPFILVPWGFYYVLRNSWFKKGISSFIKNNYKFLIALLVTPVIIIIIFYALWPFLWDDPISKLKLVFVFYKDIGTKIDRSLNIYPLQWIGITTYPVLLFLLPFGIFAAIKRMFTDKNGLGLLALLWLAIPISRSVIPGANTYGGVRQLMEYIPALAIITTLGADYLSKLKIFTKFRKLIVLIFIISFLPLLIHLYKIHPFENAYINSFAGGLSGAKEKNIPYWGNTFGGAYRSAVKYINSHAEKNAPVVLAFALQSDIPSMFFRPDLSVSNTQRSGYLAKGEYAISLNYEGVSERSYFDTYLNNNLIPVYQGMVDGVPVINVWKNSREYLKDEFKNETALKSNEYRVINKSKGFSVVLNNPQRISRIEGMTPVNKCAKIKFGQVKISSDNLTWSTFPEVLPNDWSIAILGEQPSKNGSFIYPFTGQGVKYIDFTLNPEGTCLSKIYSVKVFVFK